MKKNYFLLFSFTVALAYWILDAYANVLLYESTFSDELFLQSSHSLPFIKTLIALLIFSLGFVSPLLIKKEEEPPCVHELDALQQISEILFASFSEKINLIKSVEKLQEILEIESSLLFIYTKESITLYNESPFIKTLFNAKEIYPFRTNATLSDAEQIAIKCFLEKRSFSQDKIMHDKMNYTLFSFILKEEKCEKVFGNLMLITHNETFVNNNIEMVKKVGQMFSFVLSVSAKKEQLIANETKTSLEYIPFDPILNAMNPIKFQEHIEQEFKRFRRYNIEVSLILIEINTLKNLTNIFPEEVILNLKKDFIALIQKNIREVDVFAKWHNDQFAVLLPHLDFRGGQGMAKKLQLVVDAYKFTQIGKINCSFGITSLSSKDTMGTFRIRCESALAFAVSKGGNAIEVKLFG